jgi:hypothetical protein
MSGLSTLPDYIGALLIVGVLGIVWLVYVLTQLFWLLSKPFYIGMWAGENSARFRKGGLWWGYNHDTQNWFFIYNGKVCWQFQSWRPNFALWDIVNPFEMFRREKVMPDLPENEIMRIPAISRGKLSRNHPLRPKLEKELRASVKDAIFDARNGNINDIYLLVNSLEAPRWQRRNSFANWVSNHGTLIGIRESYDIGVGECRRAGFTLKEARELKKRYKKPVT